ncbi:hypothetical protein PANT_9c00112 [Moesziomyces antarcticus T-34]|uniref:Uncharacterized protein n=1 Tax=Pseudozyma antarctica (strain T-34) TaxID=1151754 RepID=M9MCC2_PSEA3|nr:hypothetical protein PANT_9c00112 [Moesziomyces antarcticus T-34]
MPHRPSLHWLAPLTVVARRRPSDAHNERAADPLLGGARVSVTSAARVQVQGARSNHSRYVQALSPAH